MQTRRGLDYVYELYESVLSNFNVQSTYQHKILHCIGDIKRFWCKRQKLHFIGIVL